MSEGMSDLEKLIEREVQRRVDEALANYEEEEEYEEPEYTDEEIIQMFAEVLEKMNEKQQYKTLLKIIGMSQEGLYDFFAEPPTWMGKDRIRSDKRQIAIQLLLESFIEE